MVDVEFGGIESPEFELSAVPVMAVGAHGEIAVPLSAGLQGALIDLETGSHRIVGGRGQGPGEFARLSNVGFTGDTLRVVDQTLGRVTHFPPDDGSPRVSSARGVIERGEGFLVPLPLTEAFVLSSRRMLSGGEDGPREIDGLELFAMTEGWEARTPLAELRPGIQRLRLVHEGVRSVQLGLHPFSVDPHFAYAPGVESIVVARRADGRGSPFPEALVTRIGVDGDAIFHDPLPPALSEHRGPIAQETVDAIVEFWASMPELQERFPSVAVIRSGIDEGLDPPERHPPATQLVLGIDGRSWVRGPDPWTGPVIWQVLDEGWRSSREVLGKGNVATIPSAGLRFAGPCTLYVRRFPCTFYLAIGCALSGPLRAGTAGGRLGGRVGTGGALHHRVSRGGPPGGPGRRARSQRACRAGLRRTHLPGWSPGFTQTGELILSEQDAVGMIRLRIIELSADRVICSEGERP